MIQFEFDRGIDGEGHVLSGQYDWILSIYVFRFHFMVGRGHKLRIFKRSRLSCLLHGGHNEQINNMTDPERRWWCPNCGTVWKA